MIKSELRSKFLAILDGTAPEPEAARLRSEIERDPELKAEFKGISRVLSLCRSQADAEHVLDEAFTAQVMRALPERPSAGAGRLLKILPFSPGLFGLRSGLAVRLASLFIVLVISVSILREWQAGEGNQLRRIEQLPSAGWSAAPRIPGGGREIRYNDQRVSQSVNGVLPYLEGSIGAVTMLGCGLLCLVCLGLKRYRFALIFFLLAAAIFLSRSLMSTFFNDQLQLSRRSPPAAVPIGRSGSGGSSGSSLSETSIS